MKVGKKYMSEWLIPTCMVGMLFFVSSLLLANDTIDVAYDVTSTCDTLISGDSIIIIHTVCAPICSSRARIFNKEWQEIGILHAPFNSIFPEAYIQDGKILWRDNDNFDYLPVL